MTPFLLPVVSSILALSLVAPANVAAPKKGKKLQHPVHGVVLKVEDGKEKGSKVLVVEVQHRAKMKGGPAVMTDTVRRYHIDENTKIERVLRVAKGERTTEPVSLQTLRAGEHVLIVPSREDRHEASRVAILPHHKKAKIKT